MDLGRTNCVFVDRPTSRKTYCRVWKTKENAFHPFYQFLSFSRLFTHTITSSLIHSFTSGEWKCQSYGLNASGKGYIFSLSLAFLPFISDTCIYSWCCISLAGLFVRISALEPLSCAQFSLWACDFSSLLPIFFLSFVCLFFYFCRGSTITNGANVCGELSIFNTYIIFI